MTKQFVAVAKDKHIERAVRNVLDSLNLPDLNGKKILLKPNCGRKTEPKIAVNTNPDVVSAIFEYLKEKFNAEFFIGDSPIIATNTKDAFLSSGFANLISHPDLKFIELDAPAPHTLEIKDGDILSKIRVTGYYPDLDYIISVPVLKMHMHTGASLSFKNMKGIIYKRDKIKLHHLQAPKILEDYKNTIPKIKELDIAIADLERVFRPDLVIIDGSFAQEGMGPSSGNSVSLNTIIGSTDFLAADIIALALVQPDWTLFDVPHLKLIAERRAPTKIRSISDIQTDPIDLTPFEHKISPPPESISIKYKNVRLIDIDSCSACLSTVFTFLKDNREFIDENFTEKNPLHLAIGKGVSKDDLYGNTFLIGNCTNACKEYGMFIQGCTPVQSVIRKEIERFLAAKDPEENNT